MKGMRAFVVVLIVLAVLLTTSGTVAADGGRSTIIGEEYTLRAGEHSSDDLVVLGGRVHLQPGSVAEQNVLVIGGEATLEGLVQGDVVALGGTVDLRSSAVLEGDLVVLGQLRRDPGAQVHGSVVEGLSGLEAYRRFPRLLNGRAALPVPPDPGAQARVPDGRALAQLLRTIVSIVLLMTLGALVVSIWPHNVLRAAATMQLHGFLCLTVGLLTPVVFTVLAPILVITCIGIPLLAVLLVALVVAGLLGWIAAGRIVGAKLFQMIGRSRGTLVAETILGVLIIGLVATVPCLGWLAMTLVVCWGLGAVLLTRLGTQAYPSLPPSGPAQATPASRTPMSTSSVSPAGVPQRRGDTRPLNPLRAPGDDHSDT